MAKFAGTWLSGTPGDTCKVLRLDVRDQDGVAWGTSVGTGWTPTLEVRQVDGTSIAATLTGSWEDSSDAAALFTVGASSALVPASTGDPNVFADYDAILVLSKAGVVARIAADFNSEPFRIRVQAWP